MTRDCTHHLVPDTEPCPQCLWDSAGCAGKRGPPCTPAVRRAHMAAMVAACFACVPIDRHAELRNIVAKDGPYYALRFVRNVRESPDRDRG